MNARQNRPRDAQWQRRDEKWKKLTKCDIKNYMGQRKKDEKKEEHARLRCWYLMQKVEIKEGN